jgi:hypothetical protein
LLEVQEEVQAARRQIRQMIRRLMMKLLPFAFFDGSSLASLAAFMSRKRSQS